MESVGVVDLGPVLARERLADLGVLGLERAAARGESTEEEVARQRRQKGEPCRYEVGGAAARPVEVGAPAPPEAVEIAGRGSPRTQATGGRQAASPPVAAADRPGTSR